MRLDRQNAAPLFVQIVSEVRRLIDEGTLKPGDRLPPSRKLAEILGVDRSTVLPAYAELQALGYLESRQGGFTTVACRRGEVGYDAAKTLHPAWEGLVKEKAALAGMLDQTPDSLTAGVLDLSSIEPDPRLYPLTDFRRCLRRVLDEEGAAALRYCEPQGYFPLRTQLARRLRLHGISVSEREILITNGAQQGLDLIVRALGGPGCCALVELPTYGTVLPLLRINGLRVVGLPLTDEGMDEDVLEETLIREKPVFIYTMPNFQNPTGLTTTHRHRQALLDRAVACGVPILEDGFEDDMKYEGPVPLPIKSLDKTDQVIYVGTFSKALFPGLRLGWIAAGRDFIEGLTRIKSTCDLATQTLGQMVMADFCRGGQYDRHLQRVHRLFRKRMRTALRSAQTHFPATLSWSKPVGGYTIWVRLPQDLDPAELNQRALNVGVKVSPGGVYFPQGGRSPFVRLSIARLDEGEIEEAFVRLGRMWKI